ncbi:MAG: nucleotide exchange factor GrpE [Alphaproteobacteria bacterium]
MSEKKNTPEEEADQQAERNADTLADAAGEAEAAQGSENPANPAEESDEVAALKSELAAMRDKALRAVAEAENVRRRAEKERTDTLKYAAGGLAKDLLPVVDNLRRAMESVPEEAKQEDGVMNNLMVGLEMTEKMLLESFSKSGIVRIDPKGEKFNYAEHQAMQEIPGTDQPAGTVVEVLQAGYKLHDRLLRPAMVVVAKGDAAPPKPDDAAGVDTTA